MLFPWNERTIGWMLDGAEYTGFYRLLAAKLLPHIAVRGSLCDIGCGMALADFALADEIGEITCVDVSPAALDFVRRHAAETGVKNLSAVESDGLALRGHWNTVMALFHGRVEQITPNYLAKADDRLILVTHGPAASGEKAHGNAEATAAWLDEHGFVYEKTLDALEFGQPFRRWEELPAWASAVSGGAAAEAYRIRTAAVMRRTGREDFPFYAPKTREFGIFVIPRAGNEHLL